MVIFRINVGLFAKNAEAVRRRTGDATYTARKEITVNQLEPEYLHVDPSRAGGASACRSHYSCMRKRILHGVIRFVPATREFVAYQC